MGRERNRPLFAGAAAVLVFFALVTVILNSSHSSRSVVQAQASSALFCPGDQVGEPFQMVSAPTSAC